MNRFRVSCLGYSEPALTSAFARLQRDKPALSRKERENYRPMVGNKERLRRFEVNIHVGWHAKRGAYTFNIYR